MRSRLVGTQCAALAAVLCCAGGEAAAQAAAPAAPESQPAVWTARELNFLYQGFTAKYSCTGVRDRMRSVLLHFGAREDLELTSTGCANPSGPDPFPGVRVKMYVLEPIAAGSGTPNGGQVVVAHWKTVELESDHNALMTAGECELIEQIEHFALPLLATRNVEASFNCVPNQLQLGSVRLRAEVLVSDAKAAAPTAAQ